jgi:hypothetical protein
MSNLNQTAKTRPLRQTVNRWKESGADQSQRIRAKDILDPLNDLARSQNGLFYSPVTSVGPNGRVRLDRYIFIGPQSSHQPVKLAFFGALRGTDVYTSAALVEFIRHLDASPELATGFHLYFYPIANPGGFEAGTPYTASGADLLLQLWSDSDDAEAYLVEREIAVIQFHGVIGLHSPLHLTGTSGHLHGIGGTLFESILKPTLEAASIFIPAARAGDWGSSERLSLTARADLNPRPFEIEFKVPGSASPVAQVLTFRTALHAILARYRQIISEAQGI